MNLDHDCHEGQIQDDLDEAWKRACARPVSQPRTQRATEPLQVLKEALTDDQLGVQQVHSLVLPRIFAVEIHRVQKVLDVDVYHNAEQNGVLQGN